MGILSGHWMHGKKSRNGILLVLYYCKRQDYALLEVFQTLLYEYTSLKTQQVSPL